MIEDQELRELFAAESEEHLQNLETGLLHLEKHPDDKAVLKDLFREAHSLKGAARMLGVGDVEVLSHHFEDVLGAVSKGQRTFAPGDIDRMTRGLDDIRTLSEEAVTGKPPQTTLADALQRLTEPVETPEASPPGKPAERAEGVAPVRTTPAPPPVAPAPVRVKPAPAAPAPVLPTPAAPTPVVPTPVAPTPVVPTPVAPAPVAPAPVAPTKARVDTAVHDPSPPHDTASPGAWTASPAPPEQETQKPTDPPPVAASSPPAQEEADLSSEETSVPIIRVRSHKLDALLKLVGELTVIKTRIKRRLSEVDETIATWETYNQENALSGVQPEAPSAHSGARKNEQLDNQLYTLRHGIFEDEASLELVADALGEGIRNLRLLPLATLFSQFPRMVRDLSRQQGKEVLLLTEGGETTADKRILEEMKSPLMHLMRNAIDHGLEDAETRVALGKPREGRLTLRTFQTTTHVVLEVRDDGRGLDPEAIRRQALKQGLFPEDRLAKFSRDQLYALTFQSGFSTSTMITDVSGRGVGLDAVRTNVERLKGRIQVTSEPGHGCCFTMHLPVTLATTPVFIVTAQDQTFAIPLDSVHSVRRITPQEIFRIEGCETIALHDHPVSVARLAHLLELPPTPTPLPPPWPCIILNLNLGNSEEDDEWLGVIVDTLEDELEVLLKPHGGILKRVRHLAGATILGSGDVCMVVNPQDLLVTVRKRGETLGVSDAPSEHGPGETDPKGAHKKTILLAEDSITTRTQEKRILMSAGYEVIAAVDGLDALNKLGKQPVDAVVSDVQMPNLDGLALAQKIRQNPTYKDLPIVLVTSLSSDEDMRRGMEVGANAYITKPTFDQKSFLETLRRLV